MGSRMSFAAILSVAIVFPRAPTPQTIHGPTVPVLYDLYDWYDARIVSFGPNRERKRGQDPEGSRCGSCRT